MRRVRGSRFSNLTVGLLTTLVLLPIIYLAFTKAIPFQHGYQFSAVFRTAVNIRPSSPVRIAGVEVGEVTGVESYGDHGAARVTMELQDKGLPIKVDSTLKIRPRLFLEGNFFVDLKPGSPSAKNMPDGYVVPITQTADPVQIDQVFSALTQPVRTGLQDTLDGFGAALSDEPTVAQDARQDPLVRGLTAAQALNDTYRRSGPNLRDISIVNQALLGTQPKDDIPQLIKAIGSTTQQLGRNQAALTGFIANLNTTLGAFNAQGANVSAALSELPSTLITAQRAFDGLTAVSPPLAAFARGFTDVSEQLPDSYKVTPPWVDALVPFLAPDQFGGIAKDLKELAPDLDTVIAGQQQLVPIVDDAALCGNRVVLPTINEQIQDGKFSTGTPNYQELWNAFVGFGAGGQNLDGNGLFAHLFAGAGDTVVTSGAGPQDKKISGGRAAEPPLGTRPKYPGFGNTPPFKPNVACKTQKRPDLNGPLSKGPPDKSKTP